MIASSHSVKTVQEVGQDFVGDLHTIDKLLEQGHALQVVHISDHSSQPISRVVIYLIFHNYINLLIPRLLEKCQLNLKAKLCSNKKTDVKNIEDGLVELTFINRSFSIAAISQEVIIKVCNLDQSLHLTNINTLQKNVRQFFEQKHVDFPLRGWISQDLPQPYPELIRKFIKFNLKLRWDNDFKLSQITNID